MSDATFSSQDSEAAWTALGDRMRKNRFWLLSALVACGLYMAVQGLVRLQASGDSVDWLLGHLSSTRASAVVSRDIATASPALANQPQLKTGAPRDAVAATGSGATEDSRNNAAVMGARGTPQLRHATRAAAERHGGRASHALIDRDAIEKGSASVGQWIAQWDGGKAESRDHGLRMAASALAQYARRSSAVTQGAPPPTPAASLDVRLPIQHGGAPVSVPESSVLSSPKKRASLSIHNPGDSGGPVHYLVNGQAHILRPGESQQLPQGRWRVQFDRGGDFGEAAHTLAGGSYRFAVTAQGWDLVKGE